MTTSEDEGLDAALVLIQSAFRVELDYLQLEAYRQGLSGVSDRLLKEAVPRLIRTETKFPVIATILEYTAAAYRQLGPPERRRLSDGEQTIPDGLRLIRECEDRLEAKMKMRGPERTVTPDTPKPVDPRFTHIAALPSPALCPDCGNSDLARPYQGSRTGLWLSVCKHCRANIRSSVYFSVAAKNEHHGTPQQSREPGEEG